MAAGAGGDPPTQGGAREALGEVAQSKAVRPELVIQGWPEHPGLDAGRAGGLVHLKDLVELVHVDGDQAIVSLGRRDPVHHRGASAVRDGGDPPFRAPFQDCLQLFLCAGMGDDVGRIGELPPDGRVPVPAVAVQGSLVVVAETEVGDGVGRQDARGAELQLIGLWHSWHLYGHSQPVR